MTTGRYYSHGKLLLSGEYLVLQGAKALSVPLKYGQRMLIDKQAETGFISWDTYVKDNHWFSASLRFPDMVPVIYTDPETARFVSQLLVAAFDLKGGIKPDQEGVHLQHYIDFDIHWGWGSSSSLVSNIANWLDIDLYTFYKSLFRGSGYDVFTARTDGPISYQLKTAGPVTCPVSLNPSVTSCLYFVYLGKKQDSQESVEKYLHRNRTGTDAADQVSEITEAMIRAGSPSDFMQLMRSHESLLSEVLDLPVIKNAGFSDFDGEIKSLGAWGGDFIMACSEAGEQYVRQYFQTKSLTTIFSWPEIVSG